MMNIHVQARGHLVFITSYLSYLLIFNVFVSIENVYTYSLLGYNL